MKIGVVGNGGIVKIALHALREANIEVTAMYCRNLDKAKPLVEEYQIAHAYDDYDAFLKDDTYDTVYIGLINSLHYSFSKKGLCAGKHVICEKPFTENYENTKELVDLSHANGVYLFEAIMLRYSQNLDVIQQNVNKEDVKIFQSTYCQYSSRYDAYRNGEVLPAFDPKLGGGALMDINVYNIHFLASLFGKPESLQYNANIGFNGVDTSGIMTLGYPHFQAVLIGAKDCGGQNGTVIHTSDKTIQIDSRPGIVKNIKMVDRLTGVEKSLDAYTEDNPMRQEFLSIQNVIDANDQKQVDTWLEQSLIVMDILDIARKQIHLNFSDDLKS